MNGERWWWELKTPNGDNIVFLIATDCTPRIVQTADAYTTHVTDRPNLIDSGPDPLKRLDVGNGPYRDNPLRVDLQDGLTEFRYISWGIAYKGVGPEVVSFDVVKVRGVFERRVFPV